MLLDRTIYLFSVSRKRGKPDIQQFMDKQQRDMSREEDERRQDETHNKAEANVE